MQIPIVSGIYTEAVDFRTAYPVNMMPVPKNSGISTGYLRPVDGATKLATGPGLPRGGINWNDKCYRVMGTKLVEVLVDGTVTILGDVGSGGQCSLDYSFDRLAIVSNGKLYYWDGATLTQVTDTDLGVPKAVKWVDGYFMTTDGTYLVITELSNPLSINPLKYGSSEIDPDPIQTVLKLRNEICAINRYTIEVFDNVGSDTFPFERIEGAQIQKGAIGSFATCIFAESIAFLGSGRNEAPGIYLGVNASANKISTREIDSLLLNYTSTQLSSVILEARVHQAYQHLWIRLPDRTLVYDLVASQSIGEPVWFQLTSSKDIFEAYKAVDLVWCFDSWLVVDISTGDTGKLDSSTARHFGEVVRWEFSTPIVYNEGKGAIFNGLELVCLNGRVESGETPYVSTSYSLDGVVWSQDRSIKVGILGDRLRRLAWFQQGFMHNWRIQRFKGDSRAMITVAKLEATMEQLTV